MKTLAIIGILFLANFANGAPKAEGKLLVTCAPQSDRYEAIEVWYYDLGMSTAIYRSEIKLVDAENTKTLRSGVLTTSEIADFQAGARELSFIGLPEAGLPEFDGETFSKTPLLVVRSQNEDAKVTHSMLWAIGGDLMSIEKCK